MWLIIEVLRYIPYDLFSLLHTPPPPLPHLLKLQQFENGSVISSHTLLGMWLLIHAGIKVNPY